MTVNDSPARGSASSATAPRRIRLAKAEEGDASGEMFHLIRSLVLLVGLVFFIGWVVF